MPSPVREHSVELSVQSCRVLAQFRSTEAGLTTSGGPRVQGVPRSQRVHVISPMNDLSIGDGNDRDEPICHRAPWRRDNASPLLANFIADVAPVAGCAGGE